jgi:hypothetical protein
MKKIKATLFVCILFFSCKKENQGIQVTYPRVSYTLHTNFGNQVYDLEHSSVFSEGGFMTNMIFWDFKVNGEDARSNYTCEAKSMGSSYRAYLYDTAVRVYDTATLTFSNTRQTLVFTLPEIKSFTIQNDTVSITIDDTVYTGYAKVSMEIAKVDKNVYAEPNPTITGNFNMSGKVSDANRTDSLTFSSSGTFTNMPYRN